MVIDAAVTRRSFMKGLMKAIAGSGLYSLMPLPMIGPGAALPLFTRYHPYWLTVLAKGVQFFPDNIVAFFSDWTEYQLVQSARYALFITLDQNKRALDQTSPLPEKEMDRIVESNKMTQYMFESTKHLNNFKNTRQDTADPFHAKMLSDLSSFILRDIEEKVEAPSFSGLDSFEESLLGSCTAYLENAIELSEQAFPMSEGELKEALRMNIGSSYNNLGLALSYLGDLPEARKAFLKGLDYRPGDEMILQNMDDMDSSTLMFLKRSLSRSLRD